MKQLYGLILFSVLVLLIAGCGKSVKAEPDWIVCEENVYLPIVEQAYIGGTTVPTVTPAPDATATIPPVYYCVTPTVPPTSTIPPVP